MSNEGKGEAAGRADGAATPSPRRRPGDKPFVPFARFEDVVARCGHVEKFGLLPDGKDRFREGRRKKVTGRDCKACRGKRQREEQEAAERRRAEKGQRKMQEGEQPEEALRRELREEVGLEVEKLELLTTRAFKVPRQVEIVFTAQAIGDTNELNFEIQKAAWFFPDELPRELPKDQAQIIIRALSDGAGLQD